MAYYYHWSIRTCLSIQHKVEGVLLGSNRLTFDFEPTFFAIQTNVYKYNTVNHSDQSFFALRGTTDVISVKIISAAGSANLSTAILTWFEKSVSWYAENATGQLNEKEKIYRYVAFS